MIVSVILTSAMESHRVGTLDSLERPCSDLCSLHSNLVGSRCGNEPMDVSVLVALSHRRGQKAGLVSEKDGVSQGVNVTLSRFGLKKTMKVF